jgi:integrase
VRKAGLEPLRWHDLRHTGASWAIQNGASLQDVMLLGDWLDYRSVLRYAHLAPFQAAQAADLVAQWAHIGAQSERSKQRKKA